MKPWHMRIGAYGRAFVPAPRGPWLAIVLFLRGWRPFESLCVSRGLWWSMPSPNTRRMYPQPMAIWWNGSPRRRDESSRELRMRREVIGSATLYLGDCLEILPTLGRFGAIVTDPPYGIAHLWSKGSERHGWTKANAEAVARNEWDDKPLDERAISVLLAAGDEHIIWGGNYFPLPPSRCWLVWNKPERNFSLAEAELAWTSKDAVVRVFDGPRSDQGREHPTQKPVGLMRWCVAKTVGTVCDPFMGSGTTGVACMDLNRPFVGIELNPAYFDLACRRIEDAQRQERLFA